GAINEWANGIALRRDQVLEILQAVEDGFAQAEESAQAIVEREQSGPSPNTNEDPILAALGEILQGKVGPPLSDAELSAAKADADRRFASKIPPGYMDRGKDRNPYGDYIVWLEILKQASARHSDVLFVTGDQKEDWWRTESGMLRGPRIELTREMQ